MQPAHVATQGRLLGFDEQEEDEGYQQSDEAEVEDAQGQLQRVKVHSSRRLRKAGDADSYIDLYPRRRHSLTGRRECKSEKLVRASRG